MKIKYILLAVFILSSTALFKFYSGSFLHMDEESALQVAQYEIEKRRDDLSLVSLNQSCVDIDSLANIIIQQLDSSHFSCLEIPINPKSPSDSIVLATLTTALSYATYKRTLLLSTDEKITWVYNLNQINCTDSFGFKFLKLDNDYLINDLIYLDKFLDCNCSI